MFVSVTHKGMLFSFKKLVSNTKKKYDVHICNSKKKVIVKI